MPKDRPWLKKPGELYDSKGVPIYPGDLIRSFHFMGARKKKYFLYHTAVYAHATDRDAGMRMIPTSHLEEKLRESGGACLMIQDMLDEQRAEVISGHGPGRALSYEDRPRRKT